MNKTKLKYSKREKDRIVKLIKKYLPSFYRSDLTNITNKELIRGQYENIKMSVETIVDGDLEIIVSFRITAEVLILVMIIDAMVPDLRELSERLKVAIGV